MSYLQFQFTALTFTSFYWGNWSLLFVFLCFPQREWCWFPLCRMRQLLECVTDKVVLSFVPDYQLTGPPLLHWGQAPRQLLVMTVGYLLMPEHQRFGSTWPIHCSICFPWPWVHQHIPQPPRSLWAHRPPRPAPSWGWAHRHSCCQSWNESLLLSVQGQHRLGRHIAWLNGIRKKRQAVESMIKTEGCLSLARLFSLNIISALWCCIVRSAGSELGYSAPRGALGLFSGAGRQYMKHFGKFISFVFSVL